MKKTKYEAVLKNSKVFINKKENELKENELKKRVKYLKKQIKIIQQDIKFYEKLLKSKRVKKHHCLPFIYQEVLKNLKEKLLDNSYYFCLCLFENRPERVVIYDNQLCLLKEDELYSINIAESLLQEV